jgi:hypothetical protein
VQPVELRRLIILEIIDVIAKDVNVREIREINTSNLPKKELVELSMLLVIDGQSRISMLHIKEVYYGL